MVVFPHAKVNLGLNVVRRRADGYHDMESVLLPIPLFDVLEAVVDDARPSGELQLVHSGLPVPGDPENDLCQRAYRAFHAMHPLPGMRAHLHKVIPMGAGLGGGSSDAAHMLLLLNTLSGHPLGNTELHQLAASLGSDCPFFLTNGAQLATGRGDELTPLPLDLSGWHLLLVNPGIHVSTPEAYRLTRPSGGPVDLDAALKRPMEEWTTFVRNGMEEGVFAMHPVIGTIKDQLLRAGASYAAMSGSGSSVFGLFRKVPDPPPTWPAGYRSWLLPIQGSNSRS